MSTTHKFKTRDGFKWSTKGPANGLFTKAVVPDKVTKSKYDVIVIGAGFAGLTAARDISQRSNLDVLVLEARDRIGGRTFTANEFGMDIEMGGTWVHWYQPHVWAEIDRYGLQHAIKPSATAQAAYFTDATNVFRRQGDLADMFSKIAAIIEEFFNIDGHSTRTLMPYPMDPFREPAPWKDYDHLSVQERLDQIAAKGIFGATELDICATVIANTSLTPNQSGSFVEFLRWVALSGHHLQGMSDTGGTYKLGNGGMTTLARHILQEYTGDILFSTEVVEIKQELPGNGPVRVVTSTGRTITAPFVISTIPLNVLDSIKFVPALPDLRQEALRVGQPGRGYKIHYKLAAPATPWMALTSLSSKSPFNVGIADNRAADGEKSEHMVCFGLEGRVADVRDDQAMLSAFNTYIVGDQDNDIQVEGYLCHDWAADPFAKGTWCSPGPGANIKYHQELQKAHGKVLFASSDWADGWKSFVDGAIEQGKRAAVTVLAGCERHE